MKSSDRQLCIVLDTNQWVASRMLQVGTGAALLHTAAQLKACFALPELVERELKTQYDRFTREAIKKTTESTKMLSDLLGKKVSVAIPSATDIENSFTRRFSRLERIIRRVPLTMDQVQRAIDSIICHKPPSGPNNEQFRDTVIWQAVLDLSKNFDVILITGDTAFYKDKDPKQGLALNLREEVATASGEITCYFNIGNCLTELHQDIKPIDTGKIAREIADYLRTQIAISVGELKNCSVYAFATDKSILVLSYKLTFDISPLDPRTRKPFNAALEASGECEFDPKTETILNIRRDDEEIVLSELGVERRVSVQSARPVPLTSRYGYGLRGDWLPPSWYRVGGHATDFTSAVGKRITPLDESEC